MSSSQQLLKSVSRSMYLSFAVLPSALWAPMGLAYMFCRAADTIADGTTLPVSERSRLLSRYQNLFQHFPLDSTVSLELCNEMANTKFTDSPADQNLLQKLAMCFQELRRQPLTHQALIGKVVCGVIKGMELDLNTFDEETTVPRALTSLQDMENYLLWIGGEPGRFWSEITLASLPALPIKDRERWIQNGIVFGTGLQMVNILRDLPADLKRGRCYIPVDVLATYQLSRDTLSAQEDVFRTLYVDLIEQTRLRLLRGLDYIFEIPARYWGLRAAVAWPLLIGLETLNRLQAAPTVLNAKAPIKIKRWEIYRIMIASLFLLPFNALVKKAVAARL